MVMKTTSFIMRLCEYNCYLYRSTCADWTFRFADRDIYMRYLGGGIGHHGIGISVETSRQHTTRIVRRRHALHQPPVPPPPALDAVDLPAASDDSDPELDDATFSDLIAREKAALDAELEQPAVVEGENGVGDDEAAGGLGILEDDEDVDADVCVVESGPVLDADGEDEDVFNELDGAQDGEDDGVHGGDDEHSSGEDSDDLDCEYSRL